MSRSIIILPDDSAKPILDAIAGARRSIRIKMFVSLIPRCFRPSSLRTSVGSRFA
jgi:cardiolipin synthase